MAGSRVWWDLSRADLRQRARRVRAHAVLAAQSGAAAGLAWFVAHGLLGHPAPFFAPVSAVVVLAVRAFQARSSWARSGLRRPTCCGRPAWSTARRSA
jgi:hypothetical protein